SAAQIVAEGEPAGEHDQVARRNARLGMPNHLWGAPRYGFERHFDVAVAIGAREHDDCGLHGLLAPPDASPVIAKLDKNASIVSLLSSKSALRARGKRR